MRRPGLKALKETMMATVRLQFPKLDGTGEWSNEDTYAVEDFIVKHRDGMWTAEVSIVRALGVGETHHGGGGATPEWRVVRID
jgi:hypothetical protein